MGTSLRLMRWMDLYATGIEKIDRQHETLTDLLNALNEAFRGGRPHEVLLFRLDQLIESTHEHFTDEEALMRQKEYPDIDLHKAEHDFLLAQVAHFREEFAASKAELSDSMMDYLRDWLRDHILISDRRMARFIKGEAG
ncbi:MAG: bacteriohemerythrin [Bryobacteraceae bacterium]